jgi:hypothetical protein
MSNSLNSEK